INTNETFKVKDASIDKENKTDKIEVEDEISEGNTLSASSLARSEDSRINDDLEELSQNVNGTRSIDIPTKMADDIRDMIIKTAGRMLKPMFEKDGFNYSYRPGEFVLYLKDDFYGIFIQTKTDDIVKELNEI